MRLAEGRGEGKKKNVLIGIFGLKGHAEIKTRGLSVQKLVLRMCREIMHSLSSFFHCSIYLPCVNVAELLEILTVFIFFEL